MKLDLDQREQLLIERITMETMSPETLDGQLPSNKPITHEEKESNNSQPKSFAESLKDESPKPTEKQIREWRRSFVTIRQPRVIKCGHKLKQDKQPNGNCVYCWEAFFHTVANLDELAEALREHGVKKFVAKYGEKFTKNFRGFVAQQLMSSQPQPTEVEIEGEKLAIEGSSISTTEATEIATELSLERIDAVSKETGSSQGA